jgi:ribosomal RNA-processing protein 9
MPDAFFAGSNSKKRKRTHPNGVSSSNKTAKRSSGVAASSSSLRRRVKNGQKNGVSQVLQKGVPKKRDEELESDSDAGNAVDFDEDLRASEIDEAEIREQAEMEDDEDETPAEKRLRLAKLYLESVKNDLGARGLLLDR